MVFTSRPPCIMFPISCEYAKPTMLCVCGLSARSKQCEDCCVFPPETRDNCVSSQVCRQCCKASLPPSPEVVLWGGGIVSISSSQPCPPPPPLSAMSFPNSAMLIFGLAFPVLCIFLVSSSLQFAFVFHNLNKL